MPLPEVPQSKICLRIKSLRFVLAIAIVIVSLSTGAQAQFGASLRGTVTDSTGAVIPGTTITLIEKGTNGTKKSVSDGNGIYTFNALAPGDYRVVAERDGFQKKEVAQVVLIPEQPNALDIQLQVGGADQTVTVKRLICAVAGYGYRDGQFHDQQRPDSAYALLQS